MMEFITQNGTEIIEALAMVVAAASIVANFTRTEWDNKVLKYLDKVVNLLALNLRSSDKKKDE